MKTIFIIFSTILFIFSCNIDSKNINDSGDDLGSSDEDSQVIYKEYKISGFVQKGPFVQGSEITIAEIDSELVPVGTSYTTLTIDDFGSFKLEKDMSTNFVEVSASGFYFNEVSGKLSTTGINFRVVSDLSEEKPVNINILTTIERERIKVLIGDGKTFEEARIQAEKEILSAFNINNIEINSFQEMDISKGGDSNAILLAISSVLQQGNSEAELSELISKITQDIKNDGILDAEILKNKIVENGKNLDLKSVRLNLEQRYKDLGLELTIPEFEDFVDSDGDGLINRYDFTADFLPAEGVDVYSVQISNEIKIILPPDTAEAAASVDQGVLVINGEEGSNNEKVKNGDKVAIKLNAAKMHGETETAEFKLDYPPFSVEGTYSITTLADYYFSMAFTPVKNAILDEVYTSNEVKVVLPESVPYADASILDSGTLIVNGEEKGKAAQVINGDMISIRMTASICCDVDIVGYLNISYFGNKFPGEFVLVVPREISKIEFGTESEDGSQSVDLGLDVFVDLNGNVYLTGETSGNLYRTIPTEPCWGCSDVFVTKFLSDESEVWGRQWGSGENDKGNSVKSDSDGNVYVTGSTEGSLDGNIAGGGICNSNLCSDAFLTKWTADGTKEWTQQWGVVNTSEYGNSLAIDNENNIYVTGFQTVFLTKWDSSGNQQWKKSWVASSEYAKGFSIVADDNGNVYITGECWGSLDGNVQAGGILDIFLTKWNSDGEKQWTRQWGSSEPDTGYSVVIDSDGNIFVLGVMGSIGSKVNLSKWNSIGDKLWEKQWAGFANSMAIDNEGNIFIVDEDKSFISKYDSSGEQVWTYSMEEYTGLSITYSSVTDKLYVSARNDGIDDVFLFTFYPY